MCCKVILRPSRDIFLCQMDKDTFPQSRDSVRHSQMRNKVTQHTLRVLEGIIDAVIRLVPGTDTQNFNILSLLLQGYNVKRVASELDITPDEVLSRAEIALGSLNQLQDAMTDIANTREGRARSIRNLHQHYEELLEAEKEKYRQELRKANGDKRQIQDNVFDIILNPIRRKKFLLQVPVHQLPVSNMLRSLLLNAGYDTLGDVLSRPMQKLSRNVTTDQIYTTELKKFLSNIGLGG